MADVIESFDEQKNLARVAAGFKGGPFFENINVAPAMEAGASYPKEVDAKLQAGPIDQPMPTDPWVVRMPSDKGGKV